MSSCDISSISGERNRVSLWLKKVLYLIICSGCVTGSLVVIPSVWAEEKNRSTIEEAHPGLRPTVKTRDMLPRVGGTPLAQNTQGADPNHQNGEQAGPPTKSEMSSKSGRSSSVGQVHPGLNPTVDTRDMLPRVGGAPLNPKPELAMPKEPRQAAVIKRQQLLNRFNPAIGFVFETVAGVLQTASTI